MALHKIEIIQYFKVRRSIVVEVAAEDAESAVEMMDSGAEDIPAFEDARWRDSWDLQNEIVEPVKETR